MWVKNSVDPDSALFFTLTMWILFSWFLRKQLILMTVFKMRYSKTCLKWSLKNRQKKTLMINGSLMKVESIAECSHSFDLH